MYKPVAMNGPPHAGAGVAQFPPSPAPPPPQACQLESFPLILCVNHICLDS